MIDSLGELRDKAEAQAKLHGIDPTRGDLKTPEEVGREEARLDAFRHAYTSAVMARDLGSGLANLLGIGVEAMGYFQSGANMDLWNNSVGRNLVEPGDTDEDIARKVKEALDKGELITDQATDTRTYWPKNPSGGFGPADAGYAATVPRRGDPLTFDLDGDGIETTGRGNRIVFDHNADGVKNGTGWVNADDGLLVLDRDGNGTIDSGRELFGDNTIKSNGERAKNGFDALDDVFANLRIWRDLNQDGISQSNELFGLNDLGIASINLNASLRPTFLSCFSH